MLVAFTTYPGHGPGCRRGRRVRTGRIGAERNPTLNPPCMWYAVARAGASCNTPNIGPARQPGEAAVTASTPQPAGLSTVPPWPGPSSRQVPLPPAPDPVAPLAPAHACDATPTSTPTGTRTHTPPLSGDIALHLRAGLDHRAQVEDRSGDGSGAQHRQARPSLGGLTVPPRYARSTPPARTATHTHTPHRFDGCGWMILSVGKTCEYLTLRLGMREGRLVGDLDV